MKQPPLKYSGKNIEDLPVDVLEKLQATIEHQLTRRGSTQHNKRTEKLKIDFGNTDNGYLKQLKAAVDAALKDKKQ